MALKDGGKGQNAPVDEDDDEEEIEGQDAHQ